MPRGVFLVSWGCLLVTLAAAAEHHDNLEKVLTKLDETVTADQEADEKANDKLKCWCDQTTQHYAARLDSATSDMTGLFHDIKSQEAGNAGLGMEIDGHQDELDENTQSLNTATSIRERQAERFADEETGSVQSLNALKEAKSALLPGFLQLSSAETQVKRGNKKSGVRYTPDTDQVQGVLDSLSSNFAENLKSMQADEVERSSQFEDLKAAKTQMIKASADAILRKKKHLAEGKMNVALDKENYDAMEKAHAADQELLVNLKGACKRAEEDFSARQAERLSEKTAISAARSAAAQEHATATFNKHLGMGMVSIREQGRRTGLRQSRGDPVAELRMTLAGLRRNDEQEGKWAKTLEGEIEKAKSGDAGAGGSGVSDLADEVSATQRSVQEDFQGCTAKEGKRQEKLAEEQSSADAETASASSDMEQYANAAQATTEESQFAMKAQQDAQELEASLSEVFQQIALHAHQTKDALSRYTLGDGQLGGEVTTNLRKVEASADKLSDMAEAHSNDVGQAFSGFARDTKGSLKMAQKKLTAQKMAKAELEQRRLAAEDAQDMVQNEAAAPAQNCDLLKQKGERYGRISKELTDVADSLAYEALR